MRIGINLLFLIPNKVGGTETYTRGMIESLEKYDDKNNYILFCNQENFDTFSSSKKMLKVKLPVAAKYKPLRLIFEQVLLPFYLLKYKVDLLHSFGYIGPFITPCKSIVNIFDLNWYYHPEDFSILEKFVWKFFVVFSAHFSDAITTSSFSSRKSIIDVLNLHKKIQVIYPGIPKLEKPSSIKKLKKLGIKRPYIFTLSALNPHKNISGLLRIFKKVSDIEGQVQLVIAGLGGRSRNEINEIIRRNRLTDKVLFLGWVDNQRLSTIYKFAEVFVFTSLYEGFGIPILECFNVGTPVVSSNAFSLKEAVGNGGISIDPRDEAKFVKEIIKVISLPKYKKILMKKSLAYKKKFDWMKSARKLSNFYQEVND